MGVFSAVNFLRPALFLPQRGCFYIAAPLEDNLFPAGGGALNRSAKALPLDENILFSSLPKGRYQSIKVLFEKEAKVLEGVVPPGLRKLTSQQAGQCRVSIGRLIEEHPDFASDQVYEIEYAQVLVSAGPGNHFADLKMRDEEVGRQPALDVGIVLQNPLLQYTPDEARARQQPSKYVFGRPWPEQKHPGLPVNIARETFKNLVLLGRSLGKKYLLFNPLTYHAYRTDLRVGFVLATEAPDYLEKKDLLEALEKEIDSKGLKSLFDKSWYIHKSGRWPKITLVRDLDNKD